MVLPRDCCEVRPEIRETEHESEARGGGAADNHPYVLFKKGVRVSNTANTQQPSKGERKGKPNKHRHTAAAATERERETKDKPGHAHIHHV